MGAGTEKSSNLLSSLKDTGWNTHLLFPELPSVEPRNPFDDDGGDPGEQASSVLTLIFWLQASSHSNVCESFFSMSEKVYSLWQCIFKIEFFIVKTSI